MRHRVELSIRCAATTVLAACASAPPPEPPPPAPTPTTVVEVDEENAVLVQDPPPPADPAPVSTSPKGVCAAYRERVAKTADDPRRQPAPPKRHRVHAFSKTPVQASRLADGQVQCQIVWTHEKSSVEVMVTPTCCPQSRMRGPCPAPHKQQMQGVEGIVERVVIDTEGNTSKRNVQWVSYAPPMPRHMCGRRPAGFDMQPDDSGSVGATLAEMAALEAASVVAFRRLASELETYGAPPSLVTRARGAMTDEVNHARTLRRLASERGGQPVRWQRGADAVRPLVMIALENAVEGCVNEAFGAAVAIVQGERAEDPAVREAFRRIAADECRHAALAWDVHAWLMSELSTEEGLLVTEAQRAAMTRTTCSTADERARRVLGLPDPVMSHTLFATMCDAFRSAA